MPVVDLRCTVCSHIDSHFIPASQCGAAHPESEVSTCSQCQSVSERVYDSSPTTGFREIVVHLNTRDGSYSIPGMSDDPIPGPDYKRVSITSMRQYEKVRASIDQRETEMVRLQKSLSESEFDDRMKQRRDDHQREVESAVNKGGHWVQHTDERGITRTVWAPISPRALQLLDLSRQYTDRRIQEIRSRSKSSTSNFHNRLLEMRESERSVVSGNSKRQTADLREILSRMKR